MNTRPHVYVAEKTTKLFVFAKMACWRMSHPKTYKVREASFKGHPTYIIDLFNVSEETGLHFEKVPSHFKCMLQ